MRHTEIEILVAIGAAILGGCGNTTPVSTTAESGTIQEPATEVNEDQLANTADSVDADDADNNTMRIYSETDSWKAYDSVEDLLDDAALLVKVRIQHADSANVRSYIYTTYQAEVLDTLYGALDEDSIIVNMPGGTIDGDAADEMIAEVTEGKDAGDWSDVKSISSDGNTDRLLVVGDEAYLFLIPESADTYAAVGEYAGEVLVENGNVSFDSDILGLDDGTTLLSVGNDEMTESDFVEAVTELIAAKS